MFNRTWAARNIFPTILPNSSGQWSIFRRGGDITRGDGTGGESVRGTENGENILRIGKPGCFFERKAMGKCVEAV